MIITQESPLSGQILALLKPLGKEIPFRIGEIIEGRVTDIFPSGGLTIKIKGGFLPVRSDLTFEKNETLFLKVIGQGKKNGEFILQLINTKIRSDGEYLRIGNGTDRGDHFNRKALDLIMKLIGPGVDSKKGPINQSWELGKLRVLLGELLKSLSANRQPMPRGLRTQLQQVLQAAVQESTCDFQGRIEQIIKQLSGERNQSLLGESLKEILIPMEGLDSGKLKNALENSGIFLEAKLKAMTKTEVAGGSGLLPSNQKVQHDLKAIIFKLQEFIQGHKTTDSSVGFLQRFMEGGSKIGETEPPLSTQILGTMDTLVKDIETFQLLSKISDSLHTFLPVRWDGLKRGELVLKRKQQPKGTSYSCGIHLELERLGPISVFLFMQSRNFYVNFKTDHPELKAAIRSHLEELQESFNREGLHLQSVSLLEKGDRPSDILERMESEETLINIRI